MLFQEIHSVYIKIPSSYQNDMAKAAKFLVIIGILIGIGAALLFFGSQAITSDIVIQEGQINNTQKMEIQTELDPDVNIEGVFVVQTMEGSDVSLSATILDPYEDKIIANSVTTNSFQGVFDIAESGTYTLLIETSTDEVVNVVGGIGHIPDASVYSISMAGFALLLIGMFGVVVIGIILVRGRKKAGTN